jgi:HEAT repeat protein
MMQLTTADLIDVLRSHPSVSARMYAARTLGTATDHNTARAQEALIGALADQIAAVRRQAARALHATGWAPQTDHQHALFRIAVADWDGCVALGKGAVNRLIAALHDRQAAVRWNAAKSLGCIGDERAVTPLILVLQRDDEFLVQRRALEALRRIGSDRAHDAIADWYRVEF